MISINKKILMKKENSIQQPKELLIKKNLLKKMPINKKFWIHIKINKN